MPINPSIPISGSRKSPALLLFTGFLTYKFSANIEIYQKCRRLQLNICFILPKRLKSSLKQQNNAISCFFVKITNHNKELAY